MTMRTVLKLTPLLLLPALCLLAGCDGEFHDVEVELAVELTDETMSRVEAYPAVVAAGMHVVPEEGRGSDFEIGWRTLAILEAPDQVPTFVSGVIDADFGPCTPADVDLVVELLPVHHEDEVDEPLSEISWGSRPFAERVLEEAFVLDEHCTSEIQAVDLTF